MQAMFAVIGDIDALFTDVGEVQKELEKFGAKGMVDANEIYELLETHYLRSDRVQFVTTHLLVNLGLRSTFDEEDVINVPDESDDDYLEDLHCTPSTEYNVLNEPDVLDLSSSACAAKSHTHYITRELNSIMDSSTGHVEALAACQVDICPSDSVSQNRKENSFQEPSASSSSSSSSSSSVAADASGNESYVVLNTAVQGSNTKHNLGTNNSHAISVRTSQNDNFMCDVNNNDPNNNTEYQVPVQAEGKQEQLDSTARDIDESGVEFEDQDDIRCKLLKEAVLIHRTVPRQNLEQIYSYLEANLDHKNRVQIVMQEFLRMELAPELCASAVCNNSSVGSKLEVTCNNVSETQVLSSPQPCTSSFEETDTVKKNIAKTSNHPEPQPSTSKMNGKAFKPDDVYPFTSRSTKVNKMGSAFNKKCGMKVEQGKISKSYLSVGKPGEECVTSRVTEKIQPTIDSAVKSMSSAADTEQPDVWEVSSTSTSNASAEWNCRLTDNVWGIDTAPTANCNMQTKPMVVSDDFALKTDISESSGPGWEDAKPGTSQADSYAAGETVIPSSSTESAELISHTLTRKRSKSKAESLDEESSPDKISRLGNTKQSNLLPQRKAVPVEIVLTQNQLKYKSLLMEMFPDADPQYLKQQCQTLQTEESVRNMVTELLESADYPHRQTPNEAHVESLAGPSVPVSGEDRVEMQFDTLVAILPNADPIYLRETCEKIGSDENAMKNFVTHALETKKYPTREDYLKRQEALALQKKYTEQFSIEGFLEIIPDPFKYFLEERKNNVETEHAISYLKRRYRRIRCTDLRSTFFHNHSNLALTCQELDSFKGVLRRCKRSEYECSIPTSVNIPFLQEVAFIENKMLIQDYLKDKADWKKRAFEEAKAQGALLECGCCFDNEVMLEDMAACNEGHLFCKECVRKGAEVQIGNGKTTFPCLSECVAEFSLKTLQVVLKPSVLSRMLQRKQLEEVKAAGIEDLETCPFCDFASIPPREDKVFHCLNPDCMRESCRKCKEPNHVPLRCDEVEKPDEVKARIYIEDRMTEALVRTCWKCGKKFIKEDGCNKMKCTCGALMCYICRQPVKDYSHFNGQGGDAYHKCPLYSTNDDIHVDPVREEAKKAKKEMETKNPQLKLKHDPTQILPKESGLYSDRHNPYPPHYHYHQHHDNHFGFAHPFLREPPVGVQMIHRLNRARQGIQMAVRMVAGEVNISLANNRDHQQQPQRQHVLNRNPLPPANQD